jgi:transposase
MDANVSYPLVPLPHEHGSLIPISSTLVLDFDSFDDAEPDWRALFWQCFCLLMGFMFRAVLVLRDWQLQLIDLRQRANYWQAMHGRAIEREAGWADQVQYLQGVIRELERRLYGQKSETSAAANPQPHPATPGHNGQPRPRGQQPGSRGHGRRRHDHLPTTHENHTLPPDQQCCPHCHEPFEEIPGSADGDILEIDVRAHRRRYHRQRYRCRCTCPNMPAVITAPPPDKLIPKNNIGISLWVLILQRKFEFFQPLYRILAELRSHDLHLPAGTITDGLQKLVPLFQPLYELLVEHNRGEQHWHCDETRWLVFVRRTDKAGFAWSLWVFAAKESIVFVLDPTRSHDVPEGHFGDDAQGIINVDRYSAYKAMAQVKAGKIRLAFCWAHVRRDFLAVLTSWPELTDWAWSWIEDIAVLYQRNDQRLSLVETSAHAEADRLLRDHVEHMRQRCDSELSQPELRQPQRKALTSLRNHWPGLTLFVEHPEIPLDNNEAERRERGPVVARKNFYGSGALWSGRFAAMLFSLLQTLGAWGIDTAQWLTAYLSACAQAKGQPPPNPQRYLPWNMTPQERESMSVASVKPPAPQPAKANASTTSTKE